MGLISRKPSKVLDEIKIGQWVDQISEWPEEKGAGDRFAFYEKTEGKEEQTCPTIPINEDMELRKQEIREAIESGKPDRVALYDISRYVIGRVLPYKQIVKSDIELLKEFISSEEGEVVQTFVTDIFRRTSSKQTREFAEIKKAVIYLTEREKTKRAKAKDSETITKLTGMVARLEKQVKKLSEVKK